MAKPSPSLTGPSKDSLMTDAPINLNKVRKARARADKRHQAEENAVKFGRSKIQRDREANQAATFRDRLDAHRLEDPERP